MKFEVLGPVRAVTPEGPVKIGGLRQRRLLAALVLFSPDAASAERLMEIVFEGEPPTGASGTLRTYVARLRKALGDADPEARDIIETLQGGYVLVADPSSFDSASFRTGLAHGRSQLETGDAAEAAAALRQAIDLWRGNPFEEIASDHWALPEVARLQQERLEAIALLNDSLLDTGAAEEVVSLAGALVVEHPLQERFRRQHALALYRTGRQADALRSLDEFQDALIDVGLSPSGELRSLGQAVADHDPSLRLNGERTRSLRGYQLGDEIGRSATGSVRLAVQPGTGRTVAVRSMSAWVADEPAFVRRFDAEVQRMANLEHPHIVPIFDYWREPGAAYIVMRHYPSHVGAEIAEGPLEIERIAEVAVEIGGALGRAHDAGIAHGAIKPSNVMVDEAGTYLADFGLSTITFALGNDDNGVGEDERREGEREGEGEGAAYRAPEVESGSAPTEASDQFSLAALLFHMLDGALPFGVHGRAGGAGVGAGGHDGLALPSVRRQRRSIPAAVDDVLERAMSLDPEKRWAGVDEFAAAFAAALTGQAISTPATRESVNPYRGLRPFEEVDHQNFFGRDATVRELTDRLERGGADGRFVVVIGASGSGKSSVVRAGLVPALRRGAIDGSDQWLIATMAPGDAPRTNLIEAIQSVSSTLEVTSQSSSDNAASTLIGRVGSPILLVIDQLEELFTLSGHADRRRFLDELVDAVHDESIDLRVVATMRADFFDRPLASAPFGQIVKSGAVPLVAMSAAELDAAITEPAMRQRIDIEPALSAELIAEVADEPAALPLLQFVLTQLFHGRSGQTITLEDYRELGGVGGAIAARADEVFHRHGEAERELIRRIFLRLVVVDEQRTVTKRRTTRSELAAIGDEATTNDVVEAFGEARLLAFDHESTTREPTVELAHEALTTQWPRLARWIAEAGDGLRVRSQIISAAQTWNENGRASDDLFRGIRLDSAVQLTAEQPELLSDLQHRFVRESDNARIDAIASTKAEAEHARHTNRRLRRLLTAAVVLTAVALVGVALATVERRRANSQTDEAELATLMSRSAATSLDDPQLSVLLALEAHRRRPGDETAQAVLNALGSGGAPNRLGAFPGLSTGQSCPTPAFIAPDGETQHAVIDGRLIELDLRTGQEFDRGEGPARCGVWLQGSQGNQTIVGSADADRLWLGTPSDPYATEVEHEGIAFLTDFAPEAGIGGIVSPFDENTDRFQLFSTDTGELVGDPIEVGGGAGTSAVDPSGSFFALSVWVPDEPGAGRAVVMDATSGDVIHDVPLPVFADALVFDPATLEVLAGGVDGSIMTIDLLSGSITSRVETSAGTDLIELGVQADGLVIAVSRNAIEIVDRRTGQSSQRVVLQDIVQAEVRQDGSVVTQLPSGEIEQIEIAGNALVETSWAADPFALVSFNDGHASIVNQASRQVATIDLETGQRTDFNLTNPDGSEFVAFTFYPEGSNGGWGIETSGAVARWEDGEQVETIDLPGRFFIGTRMGDLWAAIADDPRGGEVALLVDLSPGSAEVRFTVDVPTDWVGAHASPDGGLHVLTNGGTVITYDPDGRLVGTIETDSIFGLINTVDPTTGLIAIAEDRGSATIVDPATGEFSHLPNDLSVVNLGFARNGELLIVTSAGGDVRVWDVERNQLAGFVWDGDGAVWSSPSWYDEEQEATWVFSSGQIMAIPLNADDWIERGCSIAGREMTEEEWRRWVPGDEPRVSACAG